MRVRQILFFIVFLLLLAISFRPLYWQKKAQKEGTACCLSISVPQGKRFCRGRYLRFHMPKKVRGEFDESGHGFAQIPSGCDKKGIFRLGKLTPQKPENVPYLRVVAYSRWWPDTIEEPFDNFLLPRPLTKEEEKKLRVLALSRNWQLVLKVKDGYACVEDLRVDGIPLWEQLSR